MTGRWNALLAPCSRWPAVFAQCATYCHGRLSRRRILRNSRSLYSESSAPDRESMVMSVRTRVLCLTLCLFQTGASQAAPPESLLIGPGDLLHVQVADTPEMDQHPRVTDSGEAPIEGVGNVKVSGLTPAAAATAIRCRLVSAQYMKHPEVTVSIEQYATQNVSVLGEVKAAGAYPIGTPRSILDVLALAGGLGPTADRNIIIERHGDSAQRIHYNFSNDADQAVTGQIMVNPGDIVVVPKAGIVYVLGDVNHPGGYVMANNESKMTMLQALAAAGGLTKTAKQGHARLIRRENGSYSDRELSVGDLQQGKIPDIAMQPGDVLYVPFSYGRNLAVLGAGSIAGSATSAAVYAIP
jgi:polysaccharide export outer membrane protein